MTELTRSQKILLVTVLPLATIVVAWLVWDLKKPTKSPAPAPPTTTIAAPSTPDIVPTLSKQDEEKFLRLANLPVGQEQAGIEAAGAWCEAVHIDGDVEAHGDVLERYPIYGYDGPALLRAAILTFCPVFSTELAKVEEG